MVNTNRTLTRGVTSLLLAAALLVSLSTVTALAESIPESAGAQISDAVYVRSVSRSTADLYIDGILVPDVIIANYNENNTYTGLMEASDYQESANTIHLYDTIPATSNIDYAYAVVSHTEGATTVIDSKTVIGGSVCVNGVNYPLADGVRYYAVSSDGLVSSLNDFQIALNRYVDEEAYTGVSAGYPDYTAAAVYFNDAGAVSALYYVYDPTTYPTSDEYTYGDNVPVDSADPAKGSIGINQYGVVTQSGVFGIYDSEMNLVDYLAGAHTNQFEMSDYNGLASTEVSYAYMPAIVPFLKYVQTANPGINSSQTIDQSATDITISEGETNASAVLANGGIAKLGVSNIVSNSKLDSSLIDSILNTGTAYDTWDNVNDLAGAANNTAYFNVKVNEIGSQWGVNAILYAINGGVITVGNSNGARTTVTAGADSDTANLAWATTLGSKIYIYNADLLGLASGAHATDATYGGYIYVENTYMETLQGTSSILTTDFGGGTVEAKNITGIAHARGSGGSYIEGGGWTHVDNTDWADQIFQTSAEAVSFYDALTSNSGWGIDTLQDQYRDTNLIFSAADGGACVSHFGWVEYDTVNTGGAYGVLIMNRTANDDGTTSLYGHYCLENGSLTSYGAGNKANSQNETYTAAVAFFGGAAYARVDNSLVTVNTAEGQSNYLVYAATNSFMNYNFDSDGYLEFTDENGAKALYGDIAADAGVDASNRLDITMVNSEWTGAAYDTNTSASANYAHAGEISLTLDASSIWTVTGTSALTSLTVANGGTVVGEISAESTMTNADGAVTYTNAVVTASSETPASGTYTVMLVPSVRVLQDGGTLTVDVVVTSSDYSAVSNYNADISYDPSLLTLTGCTGINHFDSSSPSAGVIRVAGYGEDQTIGNSGLVIATLTFTATPASGSCTLGLSSLVVGNSADAISDSTGALSSNAPTLYINESGYAIEFISCDTYNAAPVNQKVMLVTVLNPEDGIAYCYSGEAMYYSGLYGCYVTMVDDSVTEEQAINGITAEEGVSVSIAYDGDVTGNGGAPDSNDAQLVYNFYAGKQISDTVTILQRLEADINGDQVVDSADARAIQAILLGIDE